MKEIVNQYGLYVDVYFCRILANVSTDPAVANKAESLYRQMMNDLRNHNIDSVREALNTNSDFLKDNLDRLGDGGYDVIYDGLGKQIQ